MAVREGFFEATSPNLNENGLIPHNPPLASDLPSSASRRRLRRFAPFSGLASSMSLRMSLAAGVSEDSRLRLQRQETALYKGSQNHLQSTRVEKCEVKRVNARTFRRLD
jgi:hypothetical protein